MIRTNKASLLSSALVATALFSGTTSASDKIGFNGNGELGLSSTSGNTENDSLYASLIVGYEREWDDFTSTIEANYQSEADTTTQERYSIDNQYNRFYSTNKDYFSFLSARFEQNKFEDLQLDSTYSAGLGKILLNQKTMQLKGEMGIGYQTIDLVEGEDSEQGVLRAKLDFTKQLNENVDLGQDLTVVTGSDQTKTEANTELKVKLSEQLRLKAGFKYRHNSSPAANTKSVDTQTLLTISYDF